MTRHLFRARPGGVLRETFTFTQGDQIEIFGVRPAFQKSLLSRTQVSTIGDDLVLTFSDLHLELRLVGYRGLAEASNYALGISINGIRDVSLQGLIRKAMMFKGTGAWDRLDGNDWNNTMSGLGGDDIMSGLGGDDRMWGDAGNDLLFGDNGNDRIWGGPGNDRAYGGTGNDALTGGTGNDYLAGEEGNDVLNGGLGNDTLVAWSGNDVLIDGGYGGGNAWDQDVFWLGRTQYEDGNAAFGNVTIRGFLSVKDRLMLPSAWKDQIGWTDFGNVLNGTAGTTGRIQLADGSHTVTIFGCWSAFVDIAYY